VLNSRSFEGGFHFITEENTGATVLEVIGGVVAPIFAPLGFGNWQATVATVLGLVAKEEVVGVFGALGLGTAEEAMVTIFNGSALSGFSFLVFNLLCAPCFAAMGAIKREMNNWRWTAAAISYMCVFAYAVCLMINQFGLWFTATGGNLIGTIAAGAVLVFMLYMLFRPYKQEFKTKVA